MEHKVETQATHKNTQSNNLSFTKHICKHCLLITDTKNKLKQITIGKSKHLYCQFCNHYYCIYCDAKETIIKAKNYPYCFRCVRRNKSLMKDAKDLGTCIRERCNKPATIQGTIYNKKTDDLILGNFCRKHYNHFYYYTKLKTSKNNRVSYGKVRHTQKRTNNRTLVV